MRMPFSGSVLLYPKHCLRHRHAIHYVQPTVHRNFLTQFGHSIQPPVPSGKQAAPLFKNYFLIMSSSSSSSSALCSTVGFSFIYNSPPACIHPKLFWNNLFFWGLRLLAPRPTPNLEDRGYLFLSGSLPYTCLACVPLPVATLALA